jgi:hypothetical protein
VDALRIKKPASRGEGSWWELSFKEGLKLSLLL